MTGSNMIPDHVKYPSATAAFTADRPHRRPSRRNSALQRVALLAAADAIVAASLVCAISLAARLAGQSTGAPLWMEAALASVILIALHAAYGMYDRWRSKPVQLFRLRVICAALMVMTASAYQFAHVSLSPVSVLVSVGSLLVLFVGLILAGAAMSALARRLLIRADMWARDVVIVGPKAQAGALAAALRTQSDHDFRIVGLSTVEACLERQDREADCALLVSTGDSREDLRIAAMLPFPSVISLREVGALQTLWLSSYPVGSTFGLEMRRSLLVPHNLRAKRMLDLALTVPILVVAVPIILVCAAAIVLIDWGNPFYRQVRIGAGGREFAVLKLRTMRRDAEAQLSDYLEKNPAAKEEWRQYKKLSNDPRVLPVVGNVFRRFSIDELPQFINVFRGEMSLIGPRPFPGYHLSDFDAEFRHLRNAVTPGLSGLWQITDRSDGDLERQRHADMYYIRNWSIWLDLFILVHTVPAVLAARGAR